MKMDAFILGLSNGAACIATCAPVLISYLLGEGKGIIKNFWLTIQFLFGRLVGCLLFAVIAWEVGRLIFTNKNHHNDFIFGAAYVVFSLLLIIYGFFKSNTSCKKNCSYSKREWFLLSWPALIPVAAGFFTGLSLCPPFLLAFTGAIEQTSLVHSILFFLSFFIGTSLLFVLAPFVGAFKRFSIIQIIGKMATGLVGTYYFYIGIILLIGGIKKL